MIDLALIKQQLIGTNFKNLLKRKGLTKYRLMKETGISYQTLCNWQAERNVPTDANAKLAGKKLGLISPKEEEILELKRQHKELGDKINLIEN